MQAGWRPEPGRSVDYFYIFDSLDYRHMRYVGRPNMHEAGPVEATPGLGPEREH